MSSAREIDGATARDEEQKETKDGYDFEEAQRKYEAMRKRTEKMRAAINASVTRAYGLKTRKGGGGGSSGGSPPSVPSP